MAYGKIKADAIIYDNSGSDVEKTIASLAAAAPTASPTFTGTVTVPTASANDNTTKAASTAYVQTELGDYATLAAPALTGTATAVNLTLSGTLTVNGTTTTVASTNTTIADNLLELNSGASSNANDSGIIIERGSTGDNAIFAWDESADKFVVGTTTAANDATGDLTIATQDTVKNYVAPCYVISKPGTQRVLYANEDSIFVNIHKNPNEIRDIRELEKEWSALTQKEYDEYIKNK